HLRHVLDPPGHRSGPRPEGQPGAAAGRPLGVAAGRAAPGLGRRRGARRGERPPLPADHADVARPAGRRRRRRPRTGRPAGGRRAALRAWLRQAPGAGEALAEVNARLYGLTTPTWLDRPVGDDDDGSELVDLLAADVPTPESVMIEREEEQALHDLFGVLDGRARYAVEQRFGLTDGRKRSYREVGEELGVTAEAARRLVKRAVDTVREEALARASAA